MQKIPDFMTRNVQVVRPGESPQRAAQVMGELEVEALPGCDRHPHPGHVAAALRRISDPSMPDRPSY